MSNCYTYFVPFTEEELHDAYVNKGMTQHEAAVHLGVTQKVIHTAMRKMKIPARMACKRTGQAMEQNNSWKGGRVLAPVMATENHRFLAKGSPRSYWMIRVPGHSHAHPNGYAFEHIVIALKSAGRERLLESECVHHINFNKHDNRPENLMICEKDIHRWYHGSLEIFVSELLAKGVAGFDSERGYFLITGETP